MSKSILEQLSRLVRGNPSVRKAADDPMLTAELILLIRMIFADGQLRSEEMQMFERLCVEMFGMEEDDIAKVIKYLQDFGYETTAADAAAMFDGHDAERKRELLLHMLKIAKADNELAESEADLIRKTAGILGMTADDIRHASAKVD